MGDQVYFPPPNQADYIRARNEAIDRELRESEQREFERYMDPGEENVVTVRRASRKSGANNWMWVAIAFIVAFVLVVIGIIAYFIIKWLLSNDNLPTPIGDLVMTTSPYPDVNGAPTAATAIPLANYKNGNFYGRFGYRAIIIGDGTPEKPDRSSAINWLDEDEKLKLVQLTDDSQDGGFVFRVPKQSGELCGTEIEFQLMVEYYNNKDRTGEPLFALKAHDRVAGTADPLELAESTDPAINYTLLTP